MRFLELNRRRRATKHFNAKIVNLKEIYRAIEIAIMAPSAHNLQPWKFVVVKDRKKSLSDLAFGNNAHQVNGSQFTIVLFTDTDLISCSHRIAHIGRDSLTERQLTKYMQLIPRELSSYKEQQIGEYLALNSGLVAMNLVLALTDQKIASNIILGFDKSRTNKVLEIDERFRPELLITVGYTDDQLEPTYRVPIDEVIEMR